METIADTANQLKRKYNETDPLHLAGSMNIITSFEPMGTCRGCCKGFFISYSRMKHITINGDLPKPLRDFVLAHELGHCVLHTASAADAAFHDFTLFDNTSAQEYEANVFASELLLSDEEALAILNGGNSFFQAADTRNMPSELPNLKLRILKRRLYQLKSPVTATDDFLKDLKQDAEY